MQKKIRSPLRGSWLTKKGLRVFFYRAQARSEKKARSAGVELAWLEERKAQARSEKEARSAGIELAWLEERKAQARSEKEAQSAGIELAWLEERKD